MKLRPLDYDHVLITAQTLVGFPSLINLGALHTMILVQLLAFKVWHRFAVIRTYHMATGYYYDCYQVFVIELAMTDLVFYLLGDCVHSRPRKNLHASLSR